MSYIFHANTLYFEPLSLKAAFNLSIRNLLIFLFFNFLHLYAFVHCLIKASLTCLYTFFLPRRKPFARFTNLLCFLCLVSPLVTLIKIVLKIKIKNTLFLGKTYHRFKLFFNYLNLKGIKDFIFCFTFFILLALSTFPYFSLRVAVFPLFAKRWFFHHLLCTNFPPFVSFSLFAKDLWVFPAFAITKYQNK